MIADPTFTVNWSAQKSSDRWTVPIGGGVGKLFKISQQPINSRIEAYYNIEKSDNGARLADGVYVSVFVSQMKSG